MFFSFGESLVEDERYTTRYDYERRLRSPVSKVFRFGEDAAAEEPYYALSIHGKETDLLLGIECEGPGLRPHVLLHSEQQRYQIILGFNSEVVAVDCQQGQVSFRVELPSPFGCFHEASACGLVLVFFETGVIALSSDGKERWRYDKDVIEAHQIHGNELLLQFMDSDPVRLDIGTGAVKGS